MAVWQRLLDETQNGQYLTFQCEETRDPTLPAAEWRDNSNTIILRWQNGYSPTSYALLHELVHKCGFNGYLLQWYSKPQIEQQTARVASLCYS